jgi:alpha-glucosidase
MNYFASGRAVRMWLGERDRFASPPGEEQAIGRGISGSELAQLISQHFARIPSATTDVQFNLLDSHDVARLHNNQAVFRWELYAGAVTLLYLLPGTMSVYYGDEIGIPGHAEGDHGKRFPMRWDEHSWDHRFRDLYASLMRLKSERVELHHGSWAVLAAGDEFLVWARADESNATVLVLNRAERTTTVSAGLEPLGDITVTSAWMPGVSARASWELEGSELRATLPPEASLVLLASIGSD